MRAFVVGNYMNANFMHLERLPLAGESLAATRIFQEHGGKGLNLAVGLRRLGVRVDLLMAVGADPAGAAVKERLAQEDVSTERVLTLGPTSGYGVGFIGAGDAFGSGLVWSLLRGLDLAEALRIANACGALIAAREGILEGLPRPADLDAFMAARDAPR